MRTINQIILHCSDSSFGDVATIRDWHLERNFSDIGYHHVILNGVRHYGSVYDESLDGVIEHGRPIETPGAHCKGQNEDSIGICLIGKNSFTCEQMFNLRNLLLNLMKKHDLKPENVYPHHHYNLNKSCPNWDIDDIRGRLRTVKVKIYNTD